ncbi:MAG TPA: alpha/beta hydrolase [Candidatus Limnocylindrales bacterium]|nr:alpha/beta hydrolase [Candidatus Limnocylindrales bacterium]
MATYALVPGGGGDPWDWHRLVPELEGRGHDVVAVALPAGDEAAGWAEYADAIVEAIGDRTQVVLVAHSLGAFSAPLVCERRPVDLLVLLNAMIPRPGESAEAWWPNGGRRQAQQEYLASIGLSAGAVNDDDAIYYHDVPAEIVAEARRRPEAEQSWTPMTQPWPLARWPDVPTRVLAGRDDRFLPLTAQRRLARERLGIEADEIAGGHMLALSRPKDLAERLELFRQEMTEG